MHKKIIVHIFTLLLLFTVCFSLNVQKTIGHSYDMCMVSAENVEKQEFKNMKEKEDINSTIDSNKTNTNTVHEEQTKCDPGYHYFWLFFWIILLCGIIILLYRLIKSKNSK